MARFYRLLAATSPSLVLPVASEAEAQYVEIVGTKEAHVVAATVQGGAAFLITLDRKHLANDRVRASGLPLEVLTPGEFIRLILAQHPSP
jgi:predicted nucleic acid-binding protein